MSLFITSHIYFTKLKIKHIYTCSQVLPACVMSVDKVELTHFAPPLPVTKATVYTSVNSFTVTEEKNKQRRVRNKNKFRTRINFATGWKLIIHFSTHIYTRTNQTATQSRQTRTYQHTLTHTYTHAQKNLHNNQTRTNRQTDTRSKHSRSQSHGHSSPSNPE